MSAKQYVLRPLGARDLDRAAELHRQGFAALGERPWTRQDLAELLASVGVYGLLAEACGQEAGFALCRVAADESELLTLAVSPPHRRHGAGRQLLTGVITLVREAGARSLFLEVAVDNHAAQALYRSAGFVCVATRAAYYRRGSGPPADAVVMRLTLI